MYSYNCVSASRVISGPEQELFPRCFQSTGNSIYSLSLSLSLCCTLLMCMHVHMPLCNQGERSLRLLNPLTSLGLFEWSINKRYASVQLLMNVSFRLQHNKVDNRIKVTWYIWKIKMQRNYSHARRLDLWRWRSNLFATISRSYIFVDFFSLLLRPFFFYSAHNAVVPITISFFIFQQFYLTFSYKKKKILLRIRKS